MAATTTFTCKDWLSEGKKETGREPARRCATCASRFRPPRELEQYLHYFCGDAADPNALGDTESLRISFYKAVAVYGHVPSRRYCAGPHGGRVFRRSRPPTSGQDVKYYCEIRSAIKKHSGEELDIKPYEADMRHLLNTYIQADPATEIGAN